MELAPLGINVTVLEPGYFRTDFLDSSSLSPSDNIIEDYAATAGVMRQVAQDFNKKQAGDPVKLAKAIVKLGHAVNPPLHLPMGKDALEMFKAKMARFNAEIEEWKDVIITTDLADVT